MRFSATIGDGKAVDIFAKIIGVVSKLCKKNCTIRITPQDFSFVNLYNVRDGMYMDFRIRKDQLFNSWSFDGLSADNNAVFFEISSEDLAHSVHTRENQIKLKLTRKDQVPHLRIELTSANSIINEIPITLIVARQWADYDPPNIVGISQLAVSLPPLKTLSRLISGVNSIGARHLLFRANNKGELNIIASTDLAKVSIYAHGLNNQTASGAENLSQTAYNPYHYFVVMLDLRTVYAFMSTLHTYAPRLTMKITENSCAIFIANEPECNLTLYLAGTNQD